jgi:LmbE family N-acetylglucosaminyl deacetylase
MVNHGDAAGVVLSPHPDDAVLSAWSALRRAGGALVVNVFTAMPPTGVVGPADRLLGATDSAAHMRRRLDEDGVALALAGCARTNLDLMDAQFRDGPLDVDQVRDAIERAFREAGWLCVPAGLGGHGDHVVVREAGLAIAQASAIPVALYADLPYAVEWGWPHWVTGLEARPFLVPDARWDRDLDGVSVGRERLRSRVQVLPPEEQASKLEALEAYRTQFAWLNAGPLDRLRNPEVLGFEVCWDVVAPGKRQESPRSGAGGS